MLPRQLRKYCFLSIAQSSNQPTISQYTSYPSTPTAEIEESEEYEDFTPSDEAIEETARNFKINPNQLKYLGQGLFNKVYAYQDKVIKFTTTVRDVASLEILQNLATKVTYPKHLLQVFSIEEDLKTGVFICIVEKLDRLPSNIRALLSHSLPFQKSDINKFKSFKIKKLFESKKIFLHNLNNIINDLDTLEIGDSVSTSDNKEYITKIKNQDLNYLFDLLQQRAAAHRFSYHTNLEEYKKLITQVFSDFFHPTNELEKKIINTLTEQFIFNFSNSFRLFFPTEHAKGIESEISFFSEQPETATFLQTLQELSDLGFKWGDLHTGNIMVRPSTGDLVVSDPGLFSFGK